MKKLDDVFTLPVILLAIISTSVQFRRFVAVRKCDVPKKSHTDSIAVYYSIIPSVSGRSLFQLSLFHLRTLFVIKLTNTVITDGDFEFSY